MRFSQAPLWWRLLVLAITLAILWGIGAILTAIATPLPLWGQLALLAGIFAAGIGYWLWERRSLRKHRDLSVSREPWRRE